MAVVLRRYFKTVQRWCGAWGNNLAACSRPITCISSLSFSTSNFASSSLCIQSTRTPDSLLHSEFYPPSYRHYTNQVYSSKPESIPFNLPKLNNGTPLQRRILHQKTHQNRPEAVLRMRLRRWRVRLLYLHRDVMRRYAREDMDMDYGQGWWCSGYSLVVVVSRILSSGLCLIYEACWLEDSTLRVMIMCDVICLLHSDCREALLISLFRFSISRFGMRSILYVLILQVVCHRDKRSSLLLSPFYLCAVSRLIPSPWKTPDPQLRSLRPRTKKKYPYRRKAKRKKKLWSRRGSNSRPWRY